MAKETKNKFKIQGWYYLAAPLALVVLILRDVVCGLNYPGYSWIKDSYLDYCALDSYSFVFSVILTVIMVLLFAFSAFCIWKFAKKNYKNKLLKKGFTLFLVMAIMSSITAVAFYTPKGGLFPKIKDYSQEVTRTETVASEEANDSSDASSAAATTEKKVIDEEATAENHQKLMDLVSNPGVIGKLAGILISVILCIISLALIFYGGFSKGGVLVIGIVALASLTFFLYGLISSAFFNPDTFGINSRFVIYSALMFTAFVGSYIYVNTPSKKN